MKRMYLGLMILGLWAAPVAAADRLTDKDVKSLVERIDQGRDKFKDGLDDQLKNTILRGPSGEVNVKQYLDDFKESIDKMKDRMKPGYAASSEVAAVLRQGSGIERFFRQQPPGTKGESEWNRLATDLKSLAGAYGADFPLAEGAAVRRVGDGELANIATQIAQGTEGVKKSLDNELKKDTSVDKATREGIVKETEQCSKDAKSLSEKIKDGKPSSAEAEGVLACTTRLQTFLGSHTSAASSSGAFNGLTARLKDLAGAYRTSWPSTR
jgi:hypothetical protein